ncbi:methyltransferase domain-containing protein [Jatrophihabitans cynanchi]|uniref:Methyltransferase domain-containing protein n=1 Tax=Jatrophihabitans cynanchi TaxID=2944128 RepID=A0ABY7JW61_9ACTN|nr:methyltransferase domain-containing protein [Jatrophihabitans sp. SB3-54]WAX56786.1 methyltransferase domain-containing protein [Jatrophihabitans sp. SB3-54]
MQAQTSRDSAPPGRQALIWQLLSAALSAVTSGAAAPTVLDCGGGSGSFAVPLAQAGAQVTVVDISVDALATLQRRADEAGVGGRVHAVQGDVEALTDAVGSGGFDLVLAHGILGAVDDLPAAFAAVAASVRPGGRLSVLVANPVAGVLARALAADVSAALAELRALDTAFAQPGPDAVRALCRAHGLLIDQVHGIGVFTELVPGRALEQPGAREALDALEFESATRSPFCDIAARVHLLARRPAG